MSTFRLALITVTLLAIPALAGAQQSRAGARTVSVGVNARLIVGVRLDARPAGPSTISAHRQGFTLVDLPVTAAANVSWKLSIAPGPVAPRGSIEVQGPDGVWTPLTTQAAAPVLVASGERTNPALVTVRLRLSDRRDLTMVEGLRLRMEPEGAP